MGAVNDAVANTVAAVIGVLLALLVAFGIVGSANSTPEAVDQPLVTYGER